MFNWPRLKFPKQDPRFKTPKGIFYILIDFGDGHQRKFEFTKDIQEKLKSGAEGSIRFHDPSIKDHFELLISDPK